MNKKNVLNSIIFIIIVCFISYILRFDIYEHDDFAQAFLYDSNFWNILKTADHGRYFSWIYMKIVVTYSMWIQNIHPNMDIFPKIVTGFNIALLSLIISRFITAPFKSKLSPLLFFITFLILMNIYLISPQNIYRYNQHFAYQSNLIWFFLGWGVFFSYLINNTKPLSKDLLRNSFLSFMLGVTAHFNVISSIGILGVLFCYAFIIFTIKKQKILQNFKNLGLGIYIPITTFVIGTILYFSAPSFQSLFTDRSSAEGNHILYSISLLPEFIPIWIKQVFIVSQARYFITPIIIASTIIFYNKTNIQKNIRVLVVAWAIVAGAGMFNASLILTGKSYYDTGLFWLVSSDLKVLTRMMFLSALWILIGYIISLYKDTLVTKYPVKKIYIIFCLLALLTITFKVTKNTLDIDYIKNAKEHRKKWYITEKIYRFYSLKKLDAVLPADQEQSPYWHQELYESNIENPVSWTGFYYTKKNYPLVYYKEQESRDTSIYKDYFVSYTITNNNIALTMYSNMGGIFTDKELKELNFNKLFDTNFVLNTLNK
ncbi:MAG: hypothetical protein KFW21_05845 [Spirochaetota bacterium]|nr:hypothetical protein [Spirochaetota bacterium]